jgi:hypothetical protein
MLMRQVHTRSFMPALPAVIVYGRVPSGVPSITGGVLVLEAGSNGRFGEQKFLIVLAMV